MLLYFSLEPPHQRLVDIDAQARPIRYVDMAVLYRERLRRYVVGQIRARHIQAPVIRGQRRCEVERSSRTDARFRSLVGNVYFHAKRCADLTRCHYTAQSAELDRFQAYAASSLGVVVAPYVVERMYTFVCRDRDARRGGNLRHARKIILTYRLLEKIEQRVGDTM